MRAPTPTLIRVRGKVPLADLEVLHLSDAGVECIKNLEACRRLRSLYADNNRLTSTDGVAELPNLWRIDLNGNQLRDINALTAFRALGFLHLERNRLTFNQIACLRGMHVMELRLAGNPGLVGSGGEEHIQEYRKKVVALLPNAWILDGHYVSALERKLAIEQYEAQALAVLSASPHNSAAASSSGSPSVVFSASTAQNNAVSCSMLWSSSGSNMFGVAEQHKNASKMLDALRDEPERRLLHDLYRLRLITSFHNEEAAVHSAHVQFAVNKRATNARNMPFVFLNEIQRLSRAVRLAVTVLLVSYLRFRFDRTLLVEALTIQLLESAAFPSQAIDDTASLPPYALTAIASIVRHQAIEEEDSMRRANLPQVASAAFEDDCKVWKSLPPVVHTLLVDVGGDIMDDRDDCLRSEELISSTGNGDALVWCRRAVQLLSTASSFPQLDGPAKSKKSSPSFTSIIALLHAANSSPPGGNANVNRFDKTGAASITVSMTTSKQREWRRDQPGLNRPYPRPWASTDSGERCLSESQSAPLLSSANQDATSASGSNSAGGHRRPRQGEWVEVQPKQFLKIMHLSSDGSFVSATSLSQPSNVLTIAVNQLARVSGNAWRVAGTAQDKHVGEFLYAAKAKASVDSFVGKLHRDSESFHRHGAARNQGFPNHDVQVQDVVASGVGDPPDGMNQPRPVGLFASNDTLDANYVLASPHAIAAQNFCASRTFTERNLAPAGLWQSIEYPTPFHVVAASAATGVQEPPYSAKRTTTRRDPIAASEPTDRPDEWGDIKRQLQLVLGISAPRPLSSGGDDQVASDCASVFITSSASAADNPAPQHVGSPTEASPSSSRPHFPASAGPALPRAASQPRLLPLRVSWHAVPTKTSFLVAPPSPLAACAHAGPSLAPTLSPSPSPTLSTPVARGVLKLRECNLPLPSLSTSLRQK